jgi:hypothetical protein
MLVKQNTVRNLYKKLLRLYPRGFQEQHGPNPEVAYLPGQVITLGFILFPIVAGVIAARPIVNTLRVGGSLFAHPINLIIVVFILFTFAIGFAGFIIDQMPCFLGGRGC